MLAYFAIRGLELLYDWCWERIASQGEISSERHLYVPLNKGLHILVILLCRSRRIFEQIPDDNGEREVVLCMQASKLLEDGWELAINIPNNNSGAC